MTIKNYIALSKYIAQSGYCSRRQATELVKSSKVTVNGIIVTVPFREITPTDSVVVDNNPILAEKKIYLLVNKPKNVVCSLADEKKRKTIADMLANHFQERLYPVGRLDRATTGLIIMTNDGELTQRLSHPKFEVEKTYKVTSEFIITKKNIDSLLEGVLLQDGMMKVDQAFYPTDSKRTVGVTIHSGKNHIIRRLFEEIGHRDIKLDRSSYAGLSKREIAIGGWRHLSKHEVSILQKEGTMAPKEEPLAVVESRQTVISSATKALVRQNLAKKSTTNKPVIDTYVHPVFTKKSERYTKSQEKKQLEKPSDKQRAPIAKTYPNQSNAKSYQSSQPSVDRVDKNGAKAKKRGSSSTFTEKKVGKISKKRVPTAKAYIKVKKSPEQSTDRTLNLRARINKLSKNKK